MLMSLKNEKLKYSRNISIFLILAFIGSGIGALLGLIAYGKDWF
jgi:hypothetical protein